MLKYNALKSFLSITLVVLIIGLNSCKNGEIGWDTDASCSRLFRPVTFTYYSTSTNSIGVSFTQVVGAYKYILEVSEDSLLFNNIVIHREYLADTITAYSESTTITEIEYRYRMSNLNADTRYSVRIIAVNADSTETSKYSEFTVATPAENIFTSVNPTADGATFTWSYTDSVNYILIYKASDATKTNMLVDSLITDEQKTNASKVASGLEAGVYYTAKICFLDGTKVRVRGTKSFKTTGTAGSYVYNLLSTDTVSSVLTKLITAGYSNITLNLTPGDSYNFGSVNLPAGLAQLTFSSSSSNHPSVYVTNITPGGSMEGFLFENIDFTGTSTSYILNLKSTGLTIGTIDFEGCTINTYRAALREQEAIITSFIVNNCLIKNIADYGLVNTSTTTTNKLSNCAVSNCTVINCKVFISLGNQLNSIIVTYCTFYNNTTALGYLFRFSSSYLPVSVTTTYCIFSGSNASTTLNSFYGSYTGYTTQSFSTCYKTSDLTVSTSTGKSFTGINAVSLTSSQLFTDPANGDFSIMSGVTFDGSGIAGDPRWW